MEGVTGQCQGVKGKVSSQWGHVSCQNASLQTDPGVRPGVTNFGQNQSHNVEHRTHEDHGSHNGKVLCANGFNQIAAQARNGEKGLHELMMGIKAFLST